MRRAIPLLALIAVCGCAPSALRLERYRGAYSTHFDGIPDRSEMCALVRNASARPIEWLELSLSSLSSLAERPTRVRSSWVYRGRIEPGEEVALRFEHPPMADEIALRVRRIGRDGRAPLNGRPLRRARECSDSALRALLDAGREAAASTDVELYEAADRSRDRF